MFRPRPRGAKRFAVRPCRLSAGRVDRGPIRALLAALGIACLVTAGVVLAAPPTADFTISDPVPETGQGVTFTSSVTDPDVGDTVSYGWDFGDSGSSSAQNPSHSYSTPGVKTVTLTVTDSPGGESSGPIQKTLRVNARPTAVISCSPTTVAPNQATTCNASASTDAEGAVSYAWDTNGDGFNDGSDPMEQFSFSTPGSRTIRVRVTDGDGATDIAQETVTVSNASPTADFNWSPASPVVNQTVTFNGGASSDPEGQALTYAWALDGDGQFNDGNGQTVQRAFATGGSKTIQLRVMDPQGNSNTATKIVSITNRAPTANFSSAGVNTVTPSVPEVNEQVNFASTSTDPDGNSTITTFEWDLNYNGTFVVDRVGSTMSDSFGSAGNHRVALRVTDSSGAASPVFERTVRVNAPPVASISILSTQLEPGQSRTVPLANQPFAYTGRPLPAEHGTAPAPGCPPIGASPAVAGSTDPDNASDGNSTRSSPTPGTSITTGRSATRPAPTRWRPRGSPPARGPFACGSPTQTAARARPRSRSASTPRRLPSSWRSL